MLQSHPLMLRVGISQVRILKVLNKYTLNPSDLARMVGVTRQTIANHIKNLELKGLIIHDKPNHKLLLTSSGKKVIKIIKT